MRRSSLGWILQSWGPSATLSAGFVAARLCQTEPRVVACLNEDGEMFGQTLTAGPSVPSLEPGKLITAPLAIITVGELEFKDNADFQRLRKASRTVLFRYLEDRATHGFLVTIDRASMRHLGFSDIPLLTALSDQSANRGNLELIGSVSWPSLMITWRTPLPTGSQGRSLGQTPRRCRYFLSASGGSLDLRVAATPASESGRHYLRVARHPLKKPSVKCAQRTRRWPILQLRKIFKATLMVDDSGLCWPHSRREHSCFNFSKRRCHGRRG
jgi:hypothetical protein